MSMPAVLEAAGMSMRDNASSAMRGWEQKKLDWSRAILLLF
jgi:hypothetical protein